MGKGFPSFRDGTGSPSDTIFRMIFHASLAVAILSTCAVARESRDDPYDKLKDPGLIWVLDCSAIHNVGNLHMHVTNWGCFGSYPEYIYPTSHCTSAQWPGNSGVEYLWIAGLWFGARKNGIPVVSTSAYDREFRPPGTEDPIARIYESHEGAPGGRRLPAPADDDIDGRIDEDWLNGVDDDRDGEIDEDFAAISQQMFSCWYTDDHPLSVATYPEHTPLHLFVRQESYQWEDEQFDDFVGVEYNIKNYGNDIIEDIYIGFFADGDVGPRSDDDYSQDDCVGLYQGYHCVNRGEVSIPVYMDIAYFYDCDADDGVAPGWFGILFLGHDTDPLGQDAPAHVGITSYNNFSSDQTYEQGGDPTNDYERYELMSATRNDKNNEVPRDYRMLMATGPFRELLPDSQMVLQVAFVCGYGREGMLDAAAAAVMVYEGNWFNLDGDLDTGTRGRETPVHGPIANLDPDTCDAYDSLETAMKDEIVWINADCAREIERYENRVYCNASDLQLVDFQTGVGGRETNVHWLVGTAPPPPAMRIIPGDGKITIMWDNFSEATPDPSTLEHDFEGYRIWRADGWDRPIGTSVRTGPSRDLWQLLEERDVINGIGADKTFERPYSAGGWEYEPLVDYEDRDKMMKYFEENLIYSPRDTVPCPPGLSQTLCDTIESLARFNLGLEGGHKYYKYIDDKVHNGMHYFYSITAFDHIIYRGVPVRIGKYGEPSASFQYISPISTAQGADGFHGKEIYVVPNPATRQSMAPWSLEPNMEDPTGLKVEFRNLPACRSTVRIFTLAGDLVQILYHDGSGGNGTLIWDLVSRNGQDITSGVYLFSVDADDGEFPRTVGKFIVIR